MIQAVLSYIRPRPTTAELNERDMHIHGLKVAIGLPFAWTTLASFRRSRTSLKLYTAASGMRQLPYCYADLD
jgi:hypothetical protein